MKNGKRIGDISAATGLSVHALRQWHRRYNIGPSEVSPGGQRRYTEDDIERLKLIHKVRQQGFGLSTLAEWSLPTLRKQAEADTKSCVIAWHGPSFSAMAAQAIYADVLPCDDLSTPPDGIDVWIIESPTLTDDQIDLLPDPAPLRAIVCYEFANSRQLTRLKRAGYSVERGLPSPHWLLDLIAQYTATQAGFTVHELSMLMKTVPQLECECPTHLAAILRELTSFAQYSLECVNSSPKDAHLHQSVYEKVKTAQQSVLLALHDVITAEHKIAQRSPLPDPA